MNGAFGVDQQMNLNSLFDPDRSGVGHQPYCFDQWASFYNRYRVYGCKYTVTFINTLSNDVPHVGVSFDNVATSQALNQTFWEMPNCKHSLLTEDNGGPCKKVFWGYVPLTKAYGITRVQLKTDDRYSADVGSSPAETSVLHVVGQDVFLSANVNLNVQIDLVYYAQMFDYNDPSGS